MNTDKQYHLSIVVPAYNEAQNLPVLLERLNSALNIDQLAWEVIIVDDHSTDMTFSVIQRLAKQFQRVRGYRLSCNSGSHTAIRCGLDYAQGNCVAVIAADLQDSPEVLPLMIKEWKENSQIVWAVRAARKGESYSTIFFAHIYYWIIRNLLNFRVIPPTGADFLLMDRVVVEASRRFKEKRANIFLLIASMGFRQTSIKYEKEKRLYGKSGWNLSKKINLFVDSIVQLSGFSTHSALLCLSFFFSLSLTASVFFILGKISSGTFSLVILFLLSVWIFGQSVVVSFFGEYLSRILDAAHCRPLYLIEDQTSFED